MELLTIGSELISGSTLNTNAAHLGRRLGEVGLTCARHVTVPDERSAVAAALREALRRCELLIITGGLGPTFDDITIEAIAQVTQRPLTYVPSVARQIRRFYTRRHRRLQRAALRQAYLPQGARALPNAVGTASGLWLVLPGQTVVALPGVPREMREILDRHVLPRLKRLGTLPAIETLTIRTVGMVELQIEPVLRRLRIPQTVEMGLYPHLRAVDIRLTVKHASRRTARQQLGRLARRLTRALGEAVYGTGVETLEGVIGQLLLRRRQTLGIAESCTGGLVSNRITDVPGSSRYLRGSIVAYHNDLKRGALAVPRPLLMRHGAVSAQVARAMAQGIRHVTGARLGLSITGVAGPSEQEGKPVGTIFIGVDHEKAARGHATRYQMARADVKMRAVTSALFQLRQLLVQLDGT